MEQTASDRQLNLLRIYGTLVSDRKDWGGALVLSSGAGAASSGLAAAVSIAGGTTLVLDDNAETVKAAMRRGELDFVVNTLDEALRTLKNEIRQHRALSVGLIANVATVLQEIEERGVLPDKHYKPTPEPLLRDSEHQISAANPTDLRAIDEQLLSLIPADDLVRRRWIQRAPQYLREARSGSRWIWLSDQEFNQLKQELRP